ncbi:MAG: EamA family transporter [Kiloniellales bacterium]
MPLEPGVLALVLLAAVLHASWNALVKTGGDRLVVITLVNFAPGIPALLALLWLPPMSAEAVPFLVVSVLVHFGYYAFLLGAYQHGDLSRVYPVARGSAPLLVALGAWLLAGEALSVAGWLGILVVSAGIMSLAWFRNHGAVAGEAKAIGFALLTGLSIAGYSVADGLGVRASGASFTYIAWLFAIDAFPLLLFTCWRRRGRIAAAFRPHLLRGAAGGVVATTAYGIVIWAMGQGPIAHVVALRETSVIIAAGIGTLLLGESFGRQRILAAALVAAGAIALNLSR